MDILLRHLLVLFCAGTLAACGSSADDDKRRIAFIGEEGELSANGLRLAPSAQHLRAATAEGLVALNETGEAVPALAERWIVTEDGMSYIFRLRNSEWPDGTQVTGENVRSALRRDIRQLRGTSLALDLSVISDIRAMTGRVIEIRLKTPMPQFLQLLAQPELGLRRDNIGIGPMQAEMSETGATLTVLPPERAGLPTNEGWNESQRQIEIASLPGEAATEAFDQGAVDAVFSGQLAQLPLAETGPLSRGTVRLDATFGLFGLQVRNDKGFLGDASRRGALALALDRETLLQPFNIGGWVPTTRIIPPDLPSAEPLVPERWTEMSIEQRRAEAEQRVSQWRNAENDGKRVDLSIFLPAGPGSDILFDQLSRHVIDTGISLRRAEDINSADLSLIDRLARYGDVRWFFNQFNCTLKRGLCSAETDRVLKAALDESDPAIRRELLIDAERELLRSNIYIPIGAPVRWSLIRGGVDGFEENRWGLHPLFPMALRPI